jgi:hypothetical protein
MNIPGLHAADDLQELNCRLQDLEPPDQGGAHVGEVNPKADLGGDPPGNNELNEVAATLPGEGSNPCRSDVVEKLGGGAQS